MGLEKIGSAVKRMSCYYTDLNPNTPIRQHTTAWNFLLQGIHNAFFWLSQNFRHTHTNKPFLFLRGRFNTQWPSSKINLKKEKGDAELNDTRL